MIHSCLKDNLIILHTVRNVHGTFPRSVEFQKAVHKGELLINEELNLVQSNFKEIIIYISIYMLNFGFVLQVLYK